MDVRRRQKKSLTHSNIMATKTEKRLSDIEDVLLKLMEAEERRQTADNKPQQSDGRSSLASSAASLLKPAALLLPYIIPFILGMMVGYLMFGTTGNLLPPAFDTRTTIEQQAARGGAAIPFPSGNPSPTLWSPPQENSKTELTASLWMSTSEPPLPNSPQVDNGQTNSQRSFRRTPLRIR
jgi:hypothetical protein